MRRPTQILLLTTLVLPILAQERTAAPRAQRPILELKTLEAQMLFDLAHQLGFVDNLPGLASGSHYVLTVGSDREPKVTTASGEVRFLELSVDPGGVMELFADEIGEVKGIVQGLGVMAMTQQGFSAKEATKMLRGVFDFPYLLENATLVLVRNPEEIRSTGLEIEFSVTAKSDNELGKAFQLVRPAPAGVPVMPPAADKAMDMRFSVDPAALDALLAPFLEFGLSFSYPDPEARKAAGETWARMSGMYDGGIAVTIAKDMQMEALYGFRDAEALAKLLASKEYVEMVGSQQPNRDIEIEIELDAFTHREAKFMRMTMYNDGLPNPMMPDGEMRTYTGSVGSYMVMGGSEERARRLADAVADQKIERKPLADGAVLAIDMDLRQWFEAMNMGQLTRDEVPGKMSFVLIPKGRTLMGRIVAK